MDAINYELKGIVFNMQRFSVHDGKGVRTIVFIKGCPLQCKWCSNPESQSISPVIMFQADKCIGCGQCVAACKNGALDKSNPHFVDRTKCRGCGECAAVCPTGALVLKGKAMTVGEVIKELKKDATVYRRSGGGVTISGGEGLMQSEFTAELLKACQSQGWDTAIETTGFASAEVIDKVFPYVNTALMDIKSMDGKKHKEFCGADNAVILENAERISRITRLVVRVPVIPGFNNTEEDIRSIARFAKTLHNVDTLHLLPYHNLGSNKYELLGRDYEMAGIPNMKPGELEGMKQIVENEGLTCVIGG